MQPFHYHQGSLYAETAPVDTIIQEWSTPCFIYSRAAITANYHALNQAFAEHNHQICYAVKANSNLAVLNVLARLGAGFDIVSLGELERVLAAGGDPQKIIFSGVGKTEAEIKRALEIGIFCFNAESWVELVMLDKLAGELGKRAYVALRINPNIAAGTHPYITTGLKDNKFGIPLSIAVAKFQQAMQLAHVKIRGIAFHLGSQITDLDPLKQALTDVLTLVDTLAEQNIKLDFIDVGGGLGVPYQHEKPPSAQQYAQAILQILKGRSLKIMLEPGRSIVANAGILVTRIHYIKHIPQQSFAIVDAGMNDLLRPALYAAWHAIVPVKPRENGDAKAYDIVGPVCESADFLGKARRLTIEPNDLLAIHSVGAYGFSMSSNYNTRPRATEVMVDHDKVHLIRAREKITDLFANEAMLP